MEQEVWPGQRSAETPARVALSALFPVSAPLFLESSSAVKLLAWGILHPVIPADPYMTFAVSLLAAGLTSAEEWLLFGETNANRWNS